MNRTRSWVSGLIALAVAATFIGAVASGDARGTHALPLPDGHHLHAPQPALIGSRLSIAPPEGGTTLAGARTITHFQGGGGSVLVGGGKGRAIYTGVTAFEPTLGIDKQGHIYYQGFGLHPGAEGVVYFQPNVVVSRDDGGSWDDITPPGQARTLDPYLYVDPRTDRVFTSDLSLPCTTVSYTDDLGQSWATSEACGLVDHQTVFAGPPLSSPTVGYPNVVYMCAANGGVGVYSTATSCLKSLDGGTTWVDTGAPAYTADPRQGEGTADVPGLCDGATGHGLVDANGVVYLPKGWCGQPYLAISRDEGATWERVQVADNGMPRYFEQKACAGACVTGWLTNHEAAVAIDGKGNIFYFWLAKDRLPYLAISRDGGKSFSAPIMVGAPGLTEAFGPTMDVGAGGKIALAYVGSTNAPGGKAPDGTGKEYTDAVTWNGYITTSIDSLSKNPRFATTSVNPQDDPILRGECQATRCGAIGDFIDVVIGPGGTPWTAMVDVCPPPGHECSDVTGEGWGFVGTVVGRLNLR